MYVMAVSQAQEQSQGPISLKKTGILYKTLLFSLLVFAATSMAARMATARLVGGPETERVYGTVGHRKGANVVDSARLRRLLERYPRFESRSNTGVRVRSTEATREREGLLMGQAKHDRGGWQIAKGEGSEGTNVGPIIHRFDIEEEEEEVWDELIGAAT